MKNNSIFLFSKHHLFMSIILYDEVLLILSSTVVLSIRKLKQQLGFSYYISKVKYKPL